MKNILNLIYTYFTKRSRQKKKNSNFKDLYLRVKKELKEREAPIFKPEPLPVYHPQEKPTSIYEVFIPEFFNDKKFTNNNNSDILKILNEEEQLREEIEKLKVEKMNLMCEIIGKNKNEEYKKDDKIILDKDKDINNNNFNNLINVNNVNFSNNNYDNNFFKMNEQLYEDNSFINPLKFPLDIKLENEKMFLDENYYLKY